MYICIRSFSDRLWWCLCLYIIIIMPVLSVRTDSLYKLSRSLFLFMLSLSTYMNITVLNWYMYMHAAAISRVCYYSNFTVLRKYSKQKLTELCIIANVNSLFLIYTLVDKKFLVLRVKEVLKSNGYHSGAYSYDFSLFFFYWFYFVVYVPTTYVFYRSTGLILLYTIHNKPHAVFINYLIWFIVFLFLFCLLIMITMKWILIHVAWSKSMVGFSSLQCQFFCEALVNSGKLDRNLLHISFL